MSTTSSTTDVVVVGGTLARRLGLRRGGRLVIRPDGYLGAIAALDANTTLADYFATIRS
ncbi:hypothetical protein [Mycobacterium kubicae]|uniref:hypothetical protein n=1 Tax=Mycobacterium kubicae TaxID=120959 RepID=UPI000AFD0ECF|nr:hypothetical protein [Mycobacterium kubicae]